MKNKKKLGIILIITVFLIIIGVIFLLSKSSDKLETSNNDNKNNNYTEKEPSVKVNNFDISNFEVSKNKEELVMLFKLTNLSKENIKNKQLDINIYEENKIVYTYGYLINDLNSDEYIYVQANAKFTYNNIEKFEFVIDNNAISIKPNYVN